MAQTHTTRISPWILAAIAAELALAVADLSTGAIFTTVYLLPVLALALVERAQPVAWVTGLAVALSIASGAWNDHFLNTGHIVRCLIVAGAGSLAAAGARARTELSASRQGAIAARGVAEATGRRLDAILGSLAEAVTVHDEHGKTTYANDAAVRLLGARSIDEILAAGPGELAGRFLITREDGGPVTLDDFPGRRAVAGEPAEPMLTRSVLRETGEVYWLLTKASVVHDEYGRPLAVNVIEDVTEAKEAELRQRFLAGATQVLSSSLDYDETLQRIAWLAVPAFADWCGVDIVDDGVLERVALAHRDPAKFEFGRRLSEEYPADLAAETGLGGVIRSGEPAIYPDITDEMLVAGARDERHLELIRELGMRSAMMVPMRMGGSTFGALTFVNADSGRAFDEDDLAFAQDMAARAATAVDNARLYTTLTQTAETLQRSLLPQRLAQPPGWRIAASYRAGERGSRVGGDFYDVFPVDDGWMVLLGDVTGKGVRAAALTALVRHTAKTAARFDPRPAEVMRLLNDVLREQPELSVVSVVCARLRDSAHGADVEVVSAGHPLPLRVGAAGVAPIGRYDLVLGAMGEGEWSSSRASLKPGQTLLFYTDGVTDMPGDHERFGEPRLLEALADGPSAADELIARLERLLDGFQSGERSDDRAMLAVEWVGAPRPAALRR
jgi:serine phosphatase RsbU (regulator of sigma subunit)/PAS domain-containing protein